MAVVPSGPENLSFVRGVLLFLSYIGYEKMMEEDSR